MDVEIKRMVPDHPWELAALAQARRNVLKMVERSMRADEGDDLARRTRLTPAHLRAMVSLASRSDARPCMDCHGSGQGCNPETGPYDCRKCDGMGLLEPETTIGEGKTKMSQLQVMKPTDILSEEGDRWMRSIMVTMTCGDQIMELDGLHFETFVMALGLRHLAVHPRTREIKPYSIPTHRLSGLIERHWSAIDSFDIVELATSIQRMCDEGGQADFSWRRS